MASLDPIDSNMRLLITSSVLIVDRPDLSQKDCLVHIHVFRFKIVGSDVYSLNPSDSNTKTPITCSIVVGYKPDLSQNDYIMKLHLAPNRRMNRRCLSLTFG